jgi:hypothetical protein
VHDRVEVPDPPVMDLAVKVHDRLVELVVTARVTVPVNPFNGATVTLEMLATPAFTVALVGLAARVKSWTWNTTFARWLSVPFAPVTAAE